MPYLEPKDDLKSYQQLLDELDKTEQAKMPSDIQEAIIGTESSGDPRAIGDIGAKAGESRGLMQIQRGTSEGLFKKGLLPKKWNGKPVTLKNLPNLLLDPSFNKVAGSILYEDNRKVMRQSLKNRGLPALSPEEEEESLIKMHNQGAGKTMERDVYKEAPLNPKVQAYHKKVMDRVKLAQDAPVDGSELGELQKPRFADGGFLSDNPYSRQQHRDLEEAQVYQQYLASQSGMEPPLDVGTASPLDIAEQEREPAAVEAPPVLAPEESDPYSDLMARYDAAQEQHKEDRKQAAIADFASQVSKSFAQYGVDKAAGEAQVAGGVHFKAPKLDIKATNLLGQLKAPTLDEYVKRVQMMKTLKELKGGTGASLGERKFAYQQRKDTAKAERIKAIGAVSLDPKASTNVEGYKLLKRLGIDPGAKKEFVYNSTWQKMATDKLREEQGKRVTSSKEKDRALRASKEARLTHNKEIDVEHRDKKYARDISKLDTKQADQYKGIVAEKRYHKRITDLFNSVHTGKKDYYRELIKGWIPDAEHDAAFSKLQMLSGQQLFEYIKQISGAQFSDAERKRFEQILPNVGDNPTLFKAKLEEWKTTIGQKQDVFKEGLRVQKLEIPGLFDERPVKGKLNMKMPTAAQVKKYMGMVEGLSREQAIKILTKRLNP